MPDGALIAAKTQLMYWQEEYSKARALSDQARIERCEESVRQCEVVIEALERFARMKAQ